MKPTFTLGAFAIISDNTGRVLLCHRRDRDVWNLPGGEVEHGETPWSAVAGEVEEETGLHVTVSKLLEVCAKSDRNEVVFSFQCEVIDGCMTLTDEADRIEYFAVNYLPKNLLETQRKRVRSWSSGDIELCMEET